MRDVLADLAFCSALMLAGGGDGSVIYANDFAAARLKLSGSTVSIALRGLRKCGAVERKKRLPPTELDGKSRPGAWVYVVLPREPVEVERGTEVVAQPDEPQVHVIDDPLVIGAEGAVVDRPIDTPGDRASDGRGSGG
jgi:hypothetical protein